MKGPKTTLHPCSVVVRVKRDSCSLGAVPRQCALENSQLLLMYQRVGLWSLVMWWGCTVELGRGGNCSHLTTWKRPKWNELFSSNSNEKQSRTNLGMSWRANSWRNEQFLWAVDAGIDTGILGLRFSGNQREVILSHVGPDTSWIGPKWILMPDLRCWSHPTRKT